MPKHLILLLIVTFGWENLIGAQESKNEQQIDALELWLQVYHANQRWIQPRPNQLYYKAVADGETAQMTQYVWISDDLLRWEMDQFTRSRSRKTAEYSLVATGKKEQYSTAWQEFTTGDPFGGGETYKVVQKPGLVETPALRKSTPAFLTGIHWQTGMQSLARRKRLPGKASIRYSDSGEEIIVEVPDCKRNGNLGLGARHLNYGGFSFRMDDYRLILRKSDLVPVREEMRSATNGDDPWMVVEYAPEYLEVGAEKVPARITATIQRSYFGPHADGDGQWIFDAKFQIVGDNWLLKQAETRDAAGKVLTTMVVSDVSTEFPDMSVFELDQEDIAQEAAATGNLLKNPKLKWAGDELSGWNIQAGAGEGRPASIVRKGEDGSLELTGDASTQTWNSVGQTISLSPGDSLSFQYTAKATDLKKEDGQYENCWAAIWFQRHGERVGRAVFSVHRDEYSSEQQIIRVPENATHGNVMFFLSKTGTLNIKDLDLQVLKPVDSFDILASQMDRYYSYFDHKGIDWQSLADKYRDRAIGADDNDEFEDVVLEMLAELKDGHTWIMKNGRRVSRYERKQWKPNFKFATISGELKDVRKFGQIGLVGKTDDNIAYVRVTSLVGQPADMQPMIDAVNDLFDTDGMIIDLRMNRGGSEDLGMMLAGLFCKQPVTYARNRFRKNEKHDDFYEYRRSPLQPRDGEFYGKPVVCLIGPGAVSSGEGTALMFDALPNVTTMGQPTYGSSGNPAPVALPNGVEVWFSRWVATDGEGTPIEDRGVLPDIVVDHSGDGDPTWERAKAEIGK